MRVIRYSSGSIVRSDASEPARSDAVEAAYRRHLAAEHRRIFGVADAMAAMEAALTAPSPKATPRLDSKTARSGFIKSTEAAWKTPAVGATRGG